MLFFFGCRFTGPWPRCAQGTHIVSSPVVVDANGDGLGDTVIIANDYKMHMGGANLPFFGGPHAKSTPS